MKENEDFQVTIEDASETKIINSSPAKKAKTTKQDKQEEQEENKCYQEEE